MKENSEQVLTRKMRRILLISLIFTGGCSVSSLVEIVQDTLQGVWSYIGWAQYLYTMVFCSVIILFLRSYCFTGHTGHLPISFPKAFF